jgi:hypothetical protein
MPERPVASIIDSVAERLAVTAPDGEGSTWNITDGNAVTGDWLLQTPNCWGQADCAHPIGIEKFESAIRDLVGSARTSVDLVTLNPLPTGRFRTALIDGLRRSIAAGNTPTVRILAGLYPFSTSFAQPFADLSLETVRQYTDVLMGDVGAGADRLSVVVARAASNQLVSWNHAKVLVVDGRELIEGGHNFWSNSYLQISDPVHDVSMQLSGPAAHDAVVFTDILWTEACSHRGNPAMADITMAGVAVACPDAVADNLPVAPSNAAGVRMLSVARLGIDIGAPIPNAGTVNPSNPASCFPFPDLTNLGGAAYDAQNPGEEAVRAMIRRANDEVFISQQDLIGTCPVPRYDARLFAAIAEALARGVRVTIVVSTPGAQTASGTAYSNTASLSEILRPLVVSARALPNATKASANASICANLQLASIRFGPTETSAWPNGHKFANHAKLLEVDHRAFTVGSGNMYPAWLQEFGYIVEDDALTAQLHEQYLDPLWTWSKTTALVDPEQGRCPLAPVL